MCVARCFAVWIEHAESSRRMKQVCAKLLHRSGFVSNRFFFRCWCSFLLIKKRLLVCSVRAVSRFCFFSLRNFFRHWFSLVTNFKRHQIESLLLSLEEEFSRMRVVNDDYAQHRQHLEIKVVKLEEEVVRLRNHGQSVSDEALQLARLNQKYMQVLAQYDGWQQHFEGWMLTDAAINRLRPHLQLKLPPAVPPGLLPGFSPQRSHAAAISIVNSVSPDRHVLSPSDTNLDSKASSSASRHSNARRRGGGYDIDT